MRVSRLFFIVYFFLIVVMGNKLHGQSSLKHPKQVCQVVESFMSRNTSNRRYLELVKYKLYYLDKIQAVFYKSKPHTIYVFGNGDSDAEAYYILFYDESNYSNSFIIGDEDGLLASIRKFRDVLYDTTKMKGENVNICYGYLIVNWDPPWVFHVKDKPKQN